MSIFSRFSDIISSNINALLDKAEDPEKLLKLMIREMEDTQVEMKASCAGAMASRTKVSRNIEDANQQITNWSEKAELAVSKGREDLAREALLQKRAYQEKVDALQSEYREHEELVSQYQNDIKELEDKLDQAKKKYRILIERHIHANGKKKAQQEIRRSKTADTLVKFDQFESRIDQLEAEADLVNLKSDQPSLEEEFDKLEKDDALEQELEDLKNKVSKKTPVK